MICIVEAVGSDTAPHWFVTGVFTLSCSFFSTKAFESCQGYTPEIKKYLLLPWYGCCSPMGSTLML
jgi:hypothetical protein